LRKASAKSAHQREIVAELERHGRASEPARILLRQFEAWLALHIADRDRLRKELGGLRGQ